MYLQPHFKSRECSGAMDDKDLLTIGEIAHRAGPGDLGAAVLRAAGTGQRHPYLGWTAPLST
jgi:hypothetical protein